jgi:hypothetical protein
MTKACKAALIVAGLMIAMLPVSALAAEKPKPLPAAPIPPQILSAKKVFIANAGGDEMTGDDPIFNGGPGRAYNEFYAAMKSWGRFEIVNSPADADLLLEIRQYVSAVTPTGRGSSSFIPQFGLKIRDPKTNAILLGFNVHSQFGAGQADSDRNFSSAVGRLATEVRILVAPPEPAVQ